MAGPAPSSDATSGAPAEQWSALQIVVVALCAFINALDGMDVMIISFVAPALAKSWGVGNEALGVVFSAGLAGMMVGCLVIAPFADTWGRRPIILLALILMTAGALGCAWAPTLTWLAVMRVLTGLGIGTLLASIAALVSEYAPANRRSLAMGVFQAGYPVGAVLTGIVALWALPRFGWQGTLAGAGIVSALVIPIVWALLPESVAYLENRGTGQSLARAVRLRERLGWPSATRGPADAQAIALPRVGELLAPQLRRSTILLWLATFLSFGVLYFVTSWIPKLAVESGLSQANALWAGSIFNIGGAVGGLLIGTLATRRAMGRLIRLFFFACTGFLLLFPLGLPLALVLATAFAIGLTLQGGFSGFYSLAANLYPARIRGAGIGWAVGIGRGGAVVGPLVGGFLLATDLPLWVVFAFFAIPLALGGVLAMMAEPREMSSQ